MAAFSNLQIVPYQRLRDPIHRKCDRFVQNHSTPAPESFHRQFAPRSSSRTSRLVLSGRLIHLLYSTKSMPKYTRKENYCFSSSDSRVRYESIVFKMTCIIIVEILDFRRDFCVQPSVRLYQLFLLTCVTSPITAANRSSAPDSDVTIRVVRLQPPIPDTDTACIFPFEFLIEFDSSIPEYVLHAE